MTDAYEALRARVLSKAGLDVAASVERSFVERLIVRRAAACGIDAHAWIDRAVNGDEWGALIDAVTNGHTWFFREERALDAAVAHLRASSASSSSLRAWSAGCSTGQETWSLAMACAAQGVRADILGTDVSEAAVTLARVGSYDDKSGRGLVTRRYVEETAGGVRVVDALRERVRFEVHTLTAPPPGLFDVVLCRNVLFYLADSALPAVRRNLAAALRPGGVLIFGAAETRHGLALPLTPIEIAGRLCFQQQPPQPPASRTAPASTSVPTSVPKSAPASGSSAQRTSSAAAEAQIASDAQVASDPVVALERAHVAFLARRFDEAAALYRQALALDGLWWEPQLFLGLTERKRGLFADAAQHLERALFLEPRAWQAAMLLVGCYRRMGRIAEAEREERRARRLIEAGESAPLSTRVDVATQMLPTLSDATAALGAATRRSGE